jgi:hypothetical protein
MKLKLWLVLVMVLLVPVAVGAQSGILLNPGGQVAFESLDHAKLQSYTVGWFRVGETEPTASETIAAASATPGTGPWTGLLTLRATTRPPFLRYVLKIRGTAIPPCEFCETPWSDPGVWENGADRGTDLGYTPSQLKGFVLR